MVRGKYLMYMHTSPEAKSTLVAHGDPDTPPYRLNPGNLNTHLTLDLVYT